jgi:aminopeptidase-like protein
MQENIGSYIYKLATELFPICRSITGCGVRETLTILQKSLPDIRIKEVSSGTKAFDWTVPDEWNIKDAYVMDEQGNRIIDFQKHNLHIVGYSEPVDKEMTFEDLDPYLYSLPNQPNAIPYITSYYKRRWGFCLTEQQRNELRKNPKARYKVKIDSTLKSGVLNYGELIIKGTTDEEILLSTYICHPSMANNELSGPVVTVALAQWIKSLQNQRYTYRILFLVETIGSIIYLSSHYNEMKNNLVAGFVLTCMGDNMDYSYVSSRLGDTLSDQVAQHVLKHYAPDYKTYSFLERGSDERQYCAPGVDLPVCSVIRTKYGKYPEYHTSLDDLSFISAEGLQGGYEAVRRCLEILEHNYTYKVKVLCEPQLGKRGLYPTISTKDSGAQVRNMMNFIAYADGKHSLIEIANIIGVYAGDLIPIIKQLTEAELLEKID